ncbi:MAG: glycine betaine ABC transporter substrate-binding protein [Solirubrobacteraceae bacterium]
MGAPRPALAGLLALAALLAGPAAAAPAQQPTVRLAAPEDCLTNQGCGVGLAASYGLDVAPVFTPLAVADAGIAALDDGVAEVAVAFSTDPQVSRPDIVTLRDDRRMIGADRLVPVLRRGMLRELGRRKARRLTRRMNATGRLVTTLQLRALNQQVADGRLPEAVGGEFVEANGLTVRRRRPSGPRVTLGFQSFAENETVAHLFAASLRAVGVRVKVVDIGGLRPEAVAQIRSRRIDGWIGYARSLARFLEADVGATGSVGRELRGTLRRKAGATALKLMPGENRNLFVTTTTTAQALGLARISDLARYWPATAPSSVG